MIFGLSYPIKNLSSDSFFIGAICLLHASATASAFRTFVLLNSVLPRSRCFAQYFFTHVQSLALVRSSEFMLKNEVLISPLYVRPLGLSIPSLSLSYSLLDFNAHRAGGAGYYFHSGVNVVGV